MELIAVRKLLNHIQKMARLAITGVMRTTSTVSRGLTGLFQLYMDVKANAIAIRNLETRLVNVGKFKKKKSKISDLSL